MFSLPQSTRPKFPGQQTSFGERPVKTESELRGALGEIAARFDDKTLSGYGGSILLLPPFTITAPIVIPPGCVATTIRSAARQPLYTKGVLDYLFEVQAELVSISGLLLVGSINNYAKVFVRTAATVSHGRSITRLTVRDNFAYCDQLYVDRTAGQAHEARIADNDHIEINGAHGAAVSINSSNVGIVDNHLNAGPVSIEVLALGGNNVIRGNSLNGGQVNTNASAGFNVIMGNVNAGAITAAATDIFKTAAGDKYNT